MLLPDQTVQVRLAIGATTSLCAQMTHANQQDGGGRHTDEWQSLQGGRQAQPVCQCSRHKAPGASPRMLKARASVAMAVL